MISSPWISPINRATASATEIPTQNGCPSPSNECEEMRAMMTPVNPMIEPTDKSIPPAMITNAIPMEKIPSIAICRVVLTMFD